MDIRILVDKITGAVVAAISGYVAIDQVGSIQGLFGAIGTMGIALAVSHYIYKDSLGSSRMKHAQAREIELKNELAEIKVIAEREKLNGNPGS